MQQKTSLVQYYRQHERTSLKMIHLVISFNLKSSARIILSSQILTDHMRFLTYVRGGGLRPTSAFAVCANECALSQHYTCWGTLKQGRTLSTQGINECRLPGMSTAMWRRAWCWNLCMGPAQRQTGYQCVWEGHMQFHYVVWNMKVYSAINASFWGRQGRAEGRRKARR